MSEFFDALETREPEVREREQLAQVRRQIAHAKGQTRGFARIMQHIDPHDVTDRTSLSRIPVTRKADLIALQEGDPPFGGLVAGTWGDVARVFASPGPILEPEGRCPDYWRFARALFAAGFRRGDLVHNCFSYHFTPAGSMVEQGALALGCTVFPGGVGQTEAQAQAMAALGADGYAGTPSFLDIILERADATGKTVGRLRKALVSGEAFLGPTRERFSARGISACELYGTADLGAIAYESAAHAGLIIDEGVLVEIVLPGSGELAAEGEIGEVVVTTLTNRDYPLIRFATGDLSMLLPAGSPCGRTNVRLRGWMGRADQTTKVRGLFVHPSQVAMIVSLHPEIRLARFVIDHGEDGRDRMTLQVETRDDDQTRADAYIASIRDVTKLRGQVSFHHRGELPADGKAVEDRRGKPA